MPDEIQKYNGDNKPATSTKKTIKYYVSVPIVWLLLRVIIVGSTLYITNGLFDKPVTIVATFIIVVSAIVYGFNKKRDDFTKPEYWIGMSFCVVFFTTITIHLYSKASIEEKYFQKLSNENKILRDSIDRLRDSIQNSKAYIISAETTNANATQKLATAEKYFDANSSPSIRIVSIISNIEVNKELRINVIFENTGGVIDLTVHADCCSRDIALNTFTLQNKKVLTIKDFAPKEDKTLAFLLSGGIISKEFYDGVYADKVHIYVYGVFNCIDKFKRTYKKEFCATFNRKAEAFIDVLNYKFTYE